jgi:hypothetical protein
MNQTNRRRRCRFRDSTLTFEFTDITTSEAQVLVSSDDSYLTMGGGVSAAIRRAGGNAIALDAAKKIPDDTRSSAKDVFISYRHKDKNGSNPCKNRELSGGP